MSSKRPSAVQTRIGREGSVPGSTDIAGAYHVSAALVFSILATCHTAAAIYAPIQDCDEVFNYWEPTHYLTHGHGLQTWEYAPRFAIRSWSYAGLHALAIASFKSVLRIQSKPALFIALRLLLGLICAACETRFLRAVGKTMNERVAIFFLVISATSPGMFHASVAYLPSSFAMYAAMLGAASFMDWRQGLQTAQGIFWFAAGACLGWPFAAALSIPYLLEGAVLAILSDREGMMKFVRQFVAGTAASLALLAAQVAVDAAFYRKLTVVPLNIVLYNVFSSRGPELYGTEPWHFYFRNLALNFHVWFFLASLALPLLLLQMLLSKSSRKHYRGLTLLSPFYLWLLIFTLQPHKEERFMYPAYPFLGLNAAFSMHIILSSLGSNSSQSVVARVPVTLRLTVILGFLISALALSSLRVLSTWTAFSAPLSIYEPLFSLQAKGNVCLGKEWYRFPSHYLLPEGFHAKFIRSEFHGLLPGEFTKTTSGFSLYAGTWLEPTGMNDENIEDLGKYISIDSCDFIVDSQLPSTMATALEPSYISDKTTWQKLKCMPFLDASSTGVLGRLLWTPNLSFTPTALRRVWGEYCLLKRATPA